MVRQALVDVLGALAHMHALKVSGAQELFAISVDARERSCDGGELSHESARAERVCSCGNTHRGRFCCSSLAVSANNPRALHHRYDPENHSCFPAGGALRREACQHSHRRSRQSTTRRLG
eukprot:2505625-Rhodomonas_salina.1